jgi:ATP-dependent RNA helicase DeaD
VAGFEAVHVRGAVGAVLESLGHRPDAPEVRDVVPTAARGHNLLLVTPPSAVHAVPAFAGLVEHAAADGAGLRGLLLAPAGTLAGLEQALLPLATAAGLRLHAAETPTRAARRLRDGTVELLLTTPATARALLERSALKGESLRAVFLAWPEQHDDDEPLTVVMGEVPKDAQRIVQTADAGRVTDLVERYARRALTVGVPPADAPAEAPLGPVRTVAVGDLGRAVALREVVEVLDPAVVSVWAADERSAAEARAALATVDAAATVTIGDAPAGGVVIAWDLPTRSRLEQLLVAGEVVLFVPPHAEAWAARALRGRRPLRLLDALEQARTDAGHRRAEVVRRLEAAGGEGALYALAPLFDRYDPTLVAAALYDLWRTAGGGAPLAPPPVAMPVTETARMWVGVGSGDGATASDLVAVLVKELKLEKGRIGKVEVREKFSLVELPAADVERVSAGLTGKTVRRRRVIARPDRGAPPRGDAPRPRKPRA